MLEENKFQIKNINFSGLPNKITFHEILNKELTEVNKLIFFKKDMEEYYQQKLSTKIDKIIDKNLNYQFKEGELELLKSKIE